MKKQPINKGALRSAGGAPTNPKAPVVGPMVKGSGQDAGAKAPLNSRKGR